MPEVFNMLTSVGADQEPWRGRLVKIAINTVLDLHSGAVLPVIGLRTSQC